MISNFGGVPRFCTFLGGCGLGEKAANISDAVLHFVTSMRGLQRIDSGAELLFVVGDTPGVGHGAFPDCIGYLNLVNYSC